MNQVPIWGVVNQKGGVGKTTTAVNFCEALASRGLRVLLVDCDPQGNATSGMGIEKSTISHTLLDLFELVIDSPDGDGLPEGAIKVIRENLHIIPASLDLAGAEPVLMNAVGKELILRDTLERIKDQYDWIVIDAPPSLGILTINILAACEGVLVPMQCEFYALEGLSQLIKTVDVVRKRINPKLHIAKVLLTMVDNRNKLTQQVAKEVSGYFGEKVAKTTIPRNVRLSEAPSFGESAVRMFPGSKGAEAYKKFTSEILGK